MAFAMVIAVENDAVVAFDAPLLSAVVVSPLHLSTLSCDRTVRRAHVLSPVVVVCCTVVRLLS